VEQRQRVSAVVTVPAPDELTDATQAPDEPPDATQGPDAAQGPDGREHDGRPERGRRGADRHGGSDGVVVSVGSWRFVRDALDEHELVERLGPLDAHSIGAGLARGGDRHCDRVWVDVDELGDAGGHHPEIPGLGGEPCGRTQLRSLPTEHVEAVFGGSNRSLETIDVHLSFGQHRVQHGGAEHQTHDEERERGDEPCSTATRRHDRELGSPHRRSSRATALDATTIDATAIDSTDGRTARAIGCW